MKPDLRDAHAYGGIILLGIGWHYELWGLVIAGLLLWFMGTFRADIKGEK